MTSKITYKAIPNTRLAYDVFLDGVYIGSVKRRTTVPAGEFGGWAEYHNTFNGITRQDVVDELVQRAIAHDRHTQSAVVVSQ